MRVFNRISNFFRLNELKERIYHADEEDLTEEELEDLTNNTTSQNPFGVVALLAGAVSMTVGLNIIIIPIITIVYGILTFGTFDRKKEDNPWPFYTGFGLAFVSLVVNLLGENIHIVV